MYSASVIISFYNNTAALQCILRSLERQKQSINNFEVIIADDGSSSDSVAEVEQLIRQTSLPIKHIHQDDIGFRKNRILNKAVHRSESEYLIFIDGDCIPQDNFVADHLFSSEKGHVLNGRRVDLPSQYKSKLYSTDTPNQFFSDNLLSILFNYLKGQGKNIEKGFRVKNKAISAFLNRKKKGIVGCNFSLFKTDFTAINGFNNAYEVASIGEDTDIQYRLEKHGILITNIFYKATMLHVIHPELPRLQQALDIFDQTKNNNEIIAKNGFNEAFNKN
jgi:glycosyltransferase involved in cell wall biosynthesis